MREGCECGCEVDLVRGARRLAHRRRGGESNVVRSHSSNTQHMEQGQMKHTVSYSIRDPVCSDKDGAKKRERGREGRHRRRARADSRAYGSCSVDEKMTLGEGCCVAQLGGGEQSVGYVVVCVCVCVYDDVVGLETNVVGGGSGRVGRRTSEAGQNVTVIKERTRTGGRPVGQPNNQKTGDRRWSRVRGGKGLDG